MASRGDGFGEFGGEEAFEGQLSLTGGERLPWLESDEDDEEPGVDTGRIVTLAVAALLVLALAAGAFWFFTRDRSAEAVVADGSVIEAPKEPYRTRPADPGGRQVAGTGDTSFQVAEGREVVGHIAEPAVPSPSIDREQAPVDAASPTSSGAIGVQVGAYLSREAAEAGWSTLSARLAPLQGRGHRVVEGMADSGRVFRLQAVAGSLDDAQALCSSVKAAGGDCQVKR